MSRLPQISKLSLAKSRSAGDDVVQLRLKKEWYIYSQILQHLSTCDLIHYPVFLKYFSQFQMTARKLARAGSVSTHTFSKKNLGVFDYYLNGAFQFVTQHQSLNLGNVLATPTCGLMRHFLVQDLSGKVRLLLRGLFFGFELQKDLLLPPFHK